MSLIPIALLAAYAVLALAAMTRAARSHSHKADPIMAKLSDLKVAAFTDLAAQVDANAAKAKADTAVAASSPAFAAAIKAEGGRVIDGTVTPPVLFSSADGVAFSAESLPSITDDVPDHTAPASPVVPVTPGAPVVQ